MRRLFFWFGVFAATLTVMALAGVAVLAQKGVGLDTDSRTFASGAVEAITSRSKAGELRRRASPDLLKAADAGQLASMFDRFGVLGPLVQSGGCRGSATMTAVLGQPGRTTAQYVCAARYEAEAASVSMTLGKVGGAWKISGFHVNSAVLLAHLPVRKT